MNGNGLFGSNVNLAQLKQHSTWLIGLGIALIVFGALALIFSYTSTMISVIYIGAMLTVLGIFEAVKSFKFRSWSNFILHLFLGVLFTVSGFFIMLCPLINALTLTLLLSIFFMVAGVLRIIFALMYASPHKGWLILNGAITLLLGILIYYQWPTSGLWVLGTFLGIDMIFTGWAWIMLAMMAKKA